MTKNNDTTTVQVSETFHSPPVELILETNIAPVSVMGKMVAQNLKQVSDPVLTMKAKIDALPTKSAKIRFMAGQGFKTATIAKVLGIRYQHARNVLHTIVKSA